MKSQTTECLQDGDSVAIAFRAAMNSMIGLPPFSNPGVKTPQPRDRPKPKEKGK